MRAVFVLLMLFSSLFANQTYQNLIYKKNNNFNVSLGLAEIKAHEYSWRLPYKISELEWTASNVPFLKLSSSSIVFDSAIFDSEFYLAFSKKDGDMVDDDWLDKYTKKDGLPPDSKRDPNKHTNRSIHDDTKVDSFRGMDIAIRTLPIELLYTNVSVGLGYRYDYVKLSAKNGNYYYWCSGGYPNGCTDVGSFNGKVIVYEQDFSAPYVGLYLSWYDLNGFDIGFSVKYSGIVYANDFDQHLLRATTFETETEGMKFYNARFYAMYEFKQNWSMFLDFDYTKYKAKISDVYIMDYSGESSSGVAKDGSSFDNTTFKTSIGFSYHF